MMAEALGTFVLVFLGCGVVHAAVLTGAQSGLWQVAVVWGAAVTLAIYVVGSVSGAHINPAMTAAFALWRGFPPARVPAYWLAQVAGAALAAWVLLLLFNPYLVERERTKNVIRGLPGSELTAMCYGEYFPNPGMYGDASEPYSPVGRADFDARVPMTSAFAAELVATTLLALVVFGVTEHRNHAAPRSGLAPAFIGLTVAALISVIAPLTQACFNPARDFGPRLVAYFAGWGAIAIPGPRGGFFVVYILAPTLGALAGGAIFQRVIRPSLPAESSETT
jgi:glycerol uptake facilitator protein